jgi:hypothetical protein
LPRLLGLTVLALATIGFAGCDVTGQTAVPPTPTAEPGMAFCEADVAQANLHPNDVTALDGALRDCATLDQLQRTVNANPGFLGEGVSVSDFASNRCRVESAQLSSSPVCQDLAREQPSAGLEALTSVGLSGIGPKKSDRLWLSGDYVVAVDVSTAKGCRWSLSVKPGYPNLARVSTKSKSHHTSEQSLTAVPDGFYRIVVTSKKCGAWFVDLNRP